MRIGYDQQGVSGDQGFRVLLRGLLDQRVTVSPRGMGTKEILNASVKYDFSANSPFCSRYEEPNVQRYFAGELKWYLSGSPYLEDIVDFSSFQRKATNDGVYLNSAYGARLYGTHPNRPSQLGFDQLLYCAQLLAKDPDTRRAMAVILTPEDLREDEQLNFGSNDVPCTVSIHWLIRNGELSQIVTMRSNDVMRGFVYDVPSMAFLHAVMMHMVRSAMGGAGQLLRMGPYYHNMHSIHLYERHYDDAERIMRNAGVVDDWVRLPFWRTDFLDGKARFVKGEPFYEQPWKTLNDWIAQPKQEWKK